MKTSKLLTYGGLGFLAYHLFFKKRTALSNDAKSAVSTDAAPTPEDMAGVGGEYWFRYVGSSALRVDPSSGNPIPCGVAGNPFSGAGIEGHFAKEGSAPTTYYAVLQLGTKAGINEGRTQPNSNLALSGNVLKVGDRILLKTTGGQFSALDNQIVTVVQLGTDECTSSGQPEMMNSAVVVDLPIILEGAKDYHYPAQQAIGYATKI